VSSYDIKHKSEEKTAVIIGGDYNSHQYNNPVQVAANVAPIMERIDKNIRNDLEDPSLAEKQFRHMNRCFELLDRDVCEQKLLL